MADLVPFVPAGRDAEANLRAYISAARALPFLSPAGIVWSDSRWDLSGLAKASRASDKTEVAFESKRKGFRPLLPSMSEFARAYVAFRLAESFGQRPQVHKFTKPLGMLRALAAVMTDMQISELRALRPETFDEVVARMRAAGDAEYGVEQRAMALGWIARELATMGLLNSPFEWSTAAQRGYRKSRVTQKGKSRLPSDDEVACIAEAFIKARSPREQIVTAILALSCCVPARISEILALPVDCDVVLDPGDGHQAGLRWWPRKGGAAQIKFVPRAMLPVVKEALRRLKLHTEDARHLAREVAAGRAAFASTPEGWPLVPGEQKVLYADALMVAFRYVLTPVRDVDPTEIEAITYQQVRLAMKGGSGTPSVFETIGVTRADGSYPEIDTHAPRHYLNTIANKASVPPADIALWSGRRDMRQNETYDHETPEELLKRARAALGGLELPPIPIDVEADFSIAQVKETAHTTPYGWCMQSLRQTPCAMFGSCLDCTHLVCIKGAAGKLENIRRTLDRDRALRTRARERIAAGLRVAPQWMDQFDRSIARLENLVELLESDDLIDGSPVALNRVGAPVQFDPIGPGRASVSGKPWSTGHLGKPSNG